MLIYRVENENGIGPYWSYQFDWDHEGSDYPCAFEDEPLARFAKENGAEERLVGEFFDSLGMVYAFSSIELYERWFNEEERIELSLEGFTLNVYEIPDQFENEFFVVGDTQMLFRKDKAQLVEKQSCSDLVCETA